MKEPNRVILYNDDNHDSIVWVNGVFVGVNDSELSFLSNLINNIDITRETETKYVNVTNIYIEDSENEEEGVDIIHDFLMKMNKLTEEQQRLIFQENWEELLTTIY